MEWKECWTFNFEGLRFLILVKHGLRFSFYFSSFFAVGFIEFVSSLINLFSCFSQQICSPFEKQKGKEKRREKIV
jgi:hypothetical protein